MGRTPGTCTSCGRKTTRKEHNRCKWCNETRRSKTSKPDGLNVNGDNAELVITVNEPIKTLKDLIRVCGIDTDEWEIVSWKANKWDIGAKIGSKNDKKLVTRPLFQVTATMKRKVDVMRARHEIQAMLEDAKKQMKPWPKPKLAKPAGECLLEVSIPDLHIGKLSWADETLGSNYDTKIACAVYRDALQALIRRTAAFNFSRIVLPIGNDFFHSDTKQGTTTKGTPLDTDSRFQKTYLAGRRLMIESIETLRQIAPVTVVMIPGNHDALSNFCLGDSLDCWYHATDDVTVMNAPSPRKYLQHGKVMLLWVHGNAGKLQNLPLLMATEQPQMFGTTTFREAHTGDKHQLRVQEHMGVRVRISPALCSADAWHSENMFVGNQRAAEAFVWHPEEGLVSIATYTVPED